MTSTAELSSPASANTGLTHGVTDRDYTLDHKYTCTEGRIYLSGVQALVRLPLMQRLRDQAAGLNTGGFISGYRGSPLGGFDLELWRAKQYLAVSRVKFQPGLNEDLGATMVWGTQQTNLFPGAKVDGVYAMWYGKGPGVDRCGDVFKHGNAAGTSKHGGVLALAADDHACRSSTLPHGSEGEFTSALMPMPSIKAAPGHWLSTIRVFSCRPAKGRAWSSIEPRSLPMRTTSSSAMPSRSQTAG